MKTRPLWPLLPPVVILGMMLLFLALTGGLINAHTHPLTVCGVKKLTGFDCPGCGGTRCAQNILTGQWATAFGYNPMLMTGFVLFMAFSCYLIIRMTILGKPAPTLPSINGHWIWLGLTGIALFTILRNIPSYPFTLPTP